MNKNIVLMLVLALACVAITVFAADNYVNDGSVVELTWSSASPNSGDPVIKGTTDHGGAITGVALNGTSVEGEKVSVATRGVFKLPVTIASAANSIVVGDYIYASLTNANTCTTTLSKTSASGTIFGKALEAVTGSDTVAVTQTIKILLIQSGLDN